MLSTDDMYKMLFERFPIKTCKTAYFSGVVVRYGYCNQFILRRGYFKIHVVNLREDLALCGYCKIVYFSEDLHRSIYFKHK